MGGNGKQRVLIGCEGEKVRNSRRRGFCVMGGI